MDKKEIIIDILKNNVFELSNIEIDSDQKLISTGLLESFDIINLISIFEKKFNINISFDEVEIEFFNTVNDMEKLINKCESNFNCNE